MYLSYHPLRRKKWTEHRGFPVQAVKWWEENKAYQSRSLFIYEVSDDHTEIRLVAQWTAE